jgi:hypothetical protein
VSQQLRPAPSLSCSKANMLHPTKTWGFWKNEKHNAKYEMNLDPTVSKMPGRAKPTL